jgi:membrane-associated PAP2 superfamily phosphatase
MLCDTLAASAAPSNLLRRPIALWLGALLTSTLLWDASGADLPFMRLLGSSQGFALQHAWLLERVFHGGLRNVCLVFYLLMWVWALWPTRWQRALPDTLALPRRERLGVVLLVALSLLAVNLMKVNSLTSCPWELRDFGGQARYVSHWAIGQSDGGSGRCFPGGHASSAFALIGLCLPWLAPPAGTTRQASTGFRWLWLLLLVGVVAGAAQTVRGAHFPSHTLWTLLICGGVSWAGWWLALPRLALR